MNKPKFSVRYTALMNRAAGVAKHEGGSLIERRHLLAALCAMSPKLLNRLLGCNQLFFVGELPFQDVSSLEPCKMAFSREAYRVLSIYGGELGKVVEATDANLIDIHHVGAALLIDDFPDSAVRELLSANGLSVNNAKVMESVKRIGRSGARKRREREIYRAVANIRKQMLAGVVGQDVATTRICDSLLCNWLLPPEDRMTPLVFTIVGKSGSGKTLAANILSAAIAQSREGSVTVLNGGLFASETTSHDVIGYDSSWKGGARIGTFTGPVIDNPNAIIIIENFDLLHPIARSHIMRAITVGHLKDDMAGREVSFRKATLILLTSAGCDGAYFDDTNADKTRTRIVEELTNGISDQNRRDNLSSLAGVSNEVVMLRELTINELRDVFVRMVQDEISSIKKSIAKKVDIDPKRLADILIEGISSLNPSEVAPMVKANIGDPIRKTIMDANGTDVKSIVATIDSDEAIDVNTVASNLKMRKRRLISTTASIDKTRLVLKIKSGDYTLLPAVRDGIIKIEPPQSGDSFDKLVGLESAIEYARRWINYFEGKSSIRPDGMILCGPPGTGKTSFVRCLAGEIKCPYAVLNCSELSSAEAITRAFSAFRRYGRDGLIVFLDELDAVASDRDENKTPAYVERLNLLLEQIDGFKNDPRSKILYIGATNRSSSLDAAIMRDGRLGHVINFRGLNAECRRKLMTMEMAECGINTSPDKNLLDFMVCTTEDMSGAMLKAIVRELAMSVADTGKLTRETYVKARQIVVHGDSTTTVKMDKAQLFQVAVHEASHAYVCDAVGREFIQCSLVEDGSSRLGFVESADNKIKCTSEAILGSIDISLAGRAGQEVMGLPPSGAESDLRNATSLAYSYIQNGFSADCGFLYLEEADEQMKTTARKLLNERYKKVSDLLRNSMPVISRFAKMLVERKTLFHDDLRLLKNRLLKKGAEYGN